MEVLTAKPNRSAVLIGIGLFLLTLGLAVQAALAQKSHAAFAWVGAGAAALGLALLAGAMFSETLASWLIGLAVLPVVYVMFFMGELAITGRLVPLARLASAGAVAVAYFVMARGLPGRVQYVSCVAAVGGAALFFQLWEPPPPVPVPIARSLVKMFPRTLPIQIGGQTVAVWKGEHTVLPQEIEKALGADEYLNLSIEMVGKPYKGTVFVTYSANAMTQIPHVPWVCMTQNGFAIAGQREDDFGLPSLPGRTIPANVLLFEKDVDGQTARALMFQYFNVGRNYTTNRQIARYLATTGSVGERGSYLSQTQVTIYLGPNATATPMAKDSEPYQLGVSLLNVIVPLLEKDYYPDLGGAKGG